jgi:hypothetical protein
VNTIVIYESLTGNTARAADLIADALATNGLAVANVCPTTAIDYQALSDAELVVLGTWVDGIFVVGQRPGRAGRLRRLPALAGKRAVAYCTFALDPGHTLNKMAKILSDKGAEPLGGYAINRRRLADGSKEFVDRLAGALTL